MTPDSFVVPPRRKQKAETDLKQGNEKRVKKRHYEGGVLFFDEKEEKKEEMVRERVDIEFEYSESPEALEAKKLNALKTGMLAARLYLEPANVMYLTKYWISQYVNYKLDELDWFNDHITNIMINPIRFQLTSTQGIAYVHSNLSKYSLLMHICGSALHNIPSEYFIYKECCSEIFELLCHFLEPSNQCFLVKNTFGLKGELELAAFQYNRILSYFYEPSFIIVTSYLVWVHYLLSIPRYRNLTHFLPQIRHIMKPIQHKSIPWHRLFSLEAQNTNYDEKRRVFEQDMNDLYAALDHTEIATIKNELTFIWSKKASYVSDQIYVRLDAIETQLYGV